MTILPIYLQDGTHIAHQWRIWQTGEILVQWWLNSEPRQDKYITFDSLVEYHPHFPAAARALLGEKLEPSLRKSAYNEEVVGTLQVLHRGTLTLNDLDGELCVFSSFRSLRLEGNGVGDGSTTGLPDDIYEVTGLMITLAYTPEDGHAVPYVETSTKCSTFVYREELDRTFPGWSNRYAAGLSLALPEDELMEYTFNGVTQPTQVPVKTTPLLDVTFD